MALLTDALTLLGEIGSRSGQASALNDLGAALLGSAGAEPALERHRRARLLAAEVHTPIEEARALEGIGTCLARSGDAGGGAAHLRQALAIYRRLAVPAADRVEAALRDVEAPG